jgi:hypothetical protein
MKLVLEMLLVSDQKIQAMQAKLDARPDVPLLMKRKDQLWMDDASLQDYQNLPPLDLDNNQVVSLRKGDSDSQTLRAYNDAVTEWKAACEERGYVKLKQKKCTWVCLICLLRLFCTAVATFIYFTASFCRYLW